MITIFMRALLIGMDLAVAIYFWHIIVPEDWRWLSVDQLDMLARVVPAWIVGYLLGAYHDDIWRWLRRWIR